MNSNSQSWHESPYSHSMLISSSHELMEASRSRAWHHYTCARMRSKGSDRSWCLLYKSAKNNNLIKSIPTENGFSSN